MSGGGERHMQAAVEEHLRLAGWRFFHAWNSQHSAPGFPDVVALRGQRIIVAELKGQRTRVTAEQRAWLAAFEAAGVPAYLWRFPAAWSEVGEVLR